MGFAMRKYIRQPRAQQILDMHSRHPKWCASQIAVSIGCDRAVVSRLLKRHGLKAPYPYKTLEDWERCAIAMDRKDGVKFVALAVEFGVSEAAVRKAYRKETAN